MTLHTKITLTTALILTSIGATPVRAQASSSALVAPTRTASVQVTATRFGEPVQEVPGSTSIVTGQEMRDRGALDLRTALALLGGVSVAMGGDAGPAGAAPSLLGVREVDDLLLLIDGIPAGGAFAPQVEAISLVNVERIEVLRGAAPVFFGTTAFAGTINIIHYPAGQADAGVGVRYGSFGSVGINGAMVASTGAVKQSLSGELSDDKLSDRRAGARRAQASWRAATELGGNSLRADLNLLWLRQKPTSPTPFDATAGQLAKLLPKDFNQNPSDAKLDSDRYQLVLGHERATSFGRWSSSLSSTTTQTDSIRGFIDMEDSPPPWTTDSTAAIEAFKQSRRMRDLLVDSHLTTSPLPGFDVTTGVNLLTGHADVHSLRYAHALPLNGASQLGNIDSVAPKSRVDFKDDKRFLGLYAQSRYLLAPGTSLLAGLRWNSTHESRNLTRVDPLGVTTEATRATQDIHRLSGSLGAQWRVWEAASGPIQSATLHASVGNTFQPAQTSFGPNPEVLPEGGALLKPETQRSLVLGTKIDALGGLAEFDIDGFFVDFNNQPIQTTAADGSAVLRSGGQQRYKGIDVEAALHPAANWSFKGSATWSDARYRDFVTDVDGTPTQLAGKRQVLTPNWRAAAGLWYAPVRGWRGSLTASFIGKHWLNRINTAEQAAYAVIDASVGYRFDRFTLQLSGTNLGDRRDAVMQSELGESQFYRMPSRRVMASVWVPI